MRYTYIYERMHRISTRMTGRNADGTCARTSGRATERMHFSGKTLFRLLADPETEARSERRVREKEKEWPRR